MRFVATNVQFVATSSRLDNGLQFSSRDCIKFVDLWVCPPHLCPQWLTGRKTPRYLPAPPTTPPPPPPTCILAVSEMEKGSKRPLKRQTTPTSPYSTTEPRLSSTGRVQQSCCCSGGNPECPLCQHSTDVPDWRDPKSNSA